MGTDKLDKDEFVKVPCSFVMGCDVQLAFRELRNVASSLRFWAGLAAVVLVLAVAAPFDTDTHFSFPVLLVYWGGIAAGTFFIAMGTGMVVSRALMRTGLTTLLADLSGSALASVPVTAFVVLFNRLFFAVDPIADHGLLRFFVQCMLITMAMFALFQLVEGRDKRSGGVKETGETRVTLHGENSGSVMTATTALHHRLPAEIGTDIVCLQAQDHYVDVTTSMGHAMLLMRMADAEREIEPLSGLRVHRSWWVAEQHMRRLTRQRSRHVLVLSNDIEVPVSRSRAPMVRSLLDAR